MSTKINITVQVSGSGHYEFKHHLGGEEKGPHKNFAVEPATQVLQAGSSRISPGLAVPLPASTRSV